ncbi:MAG: hypothetical protein A3J94_00640 [Syntrophus sp. RIFOXYC2_FULL_54_9]|nr:MAG: hypothetical protein A3J94_00640 [Syntrophus sp. RIFOXYC2_FULL_54_9]
MPKSKLEEIRDHCAALLGAMDASRRSKTDDPWLFFSFKTFMRKYNELVTLTRNIMKIDAPVDLYDLEKVPSAFNTVTVQQRIYFDEVYANLSILKSFIEANGGITAAEAENILNFLKANLRKAIYTEPSTERDVQNAIESLLVGKGMQKGLAYDRETGRVKHAGKESVPDFVFPNERMVLEVKFSNRDGKLASLIDEMNADIVAYSTTYERVWFLVYDMGFIRDEDEIIQGLQKSDNVKCAVVKH